MKLKKHALIILLLFIILFVCIGSASAVENQTDDIGENEVIGVSENQEILTAGEYTYSDLRNQIGTGGNVKLTKGNYTYVDGDGDTITISTSGVINGNGAVIDMAGSYYMRAFNVTASGVTIKNLTIKNAIVEGNGGAVYFSKSGTVENCNFIDNNCGESFFGGAVYFGDYGSVSNCNFTKNTASRGGAVFFNGECTVTNCNFIENTADAEGGAIMMNSGTVTNCNFTENKATGYYSLGGAISMYSGNVENCNFTENKATGEYSYGGAVYSYDGYVRNCNFTENTAAYGGAVYFYNDGTVTNCNFNNNTANGNGGAVYFNNYGNVTNCNFTGNTATVDGGAVFFGSSGTVSNCNFTDNKATGTYSYGGAVCFADNGNVTNCNFTANTATRGSAIYFYSTSAQKSVSNSTFLNNRANAKDLQVTKNENNITIIFTGNNNILNAIYSRNYAEVSFFNVTYWGASGIVNTDTYKPSISNNAAGQNITIKGVINGNIINTTKVTDKNGKIVLDAGDYLIIVSHKGDSYYTEVAERLFTNMTFNVNVTNQTSNNRTVNITAKSNIPNEVIKGKLLFILPNSTEINATYASNGTWWALHTFDDAGDYNINATYIGLDDVIINNATLRIMNVIPINTSDISISFGDIANVIVYVPETINGQNITITVNKTSKNATVKNGEAKANFTNLPAGKHLITADYLGDDYNCANSTNATLTVSKRPTEISLKNKTIDLFVKSSIETGATLIPADAGNLTYTVSNPSVAIVENGEIKGIKQGKTNITVSFAGNENYTAAENKTISVTVNLNDASITVNNETLNLKIGQNFTIVATTTPEGINVTYVQDDSGVYIVDENGVVTALKNGTGSVLVKIGGDGVYAENSTIVNVTVSKVPTEIKVTNTTLDLKVDGEIETGATLIPADAGNLTYTVSNPSIVKVEEGKIIALKEGNATITVSFEGNKKYLTAENKTVNVTVSLNDASVKVNNNTLNLLVDETFNLIATTEPKDLTVNYTSSNPSVVTVDNKGNVMAVSEGNATITVTVGGDGKYAENSTTVTVTVSKVPTEISINPDSLDLFVGDETVIVANLTPSDAGNVTFTSSDDSVVTVDAEGNVIAQGKGTAIITVSFAGDNKYAAAENKTIKVTVKKINAPMNVSAEDITVGENATVIITDLENATGNVSLIVNGKTYTAPINNGEAVITVPGLTENVTAVINYPGDDKYNSAVTTVNITVNRNTVSITAENMTKYYKGPEKFTVKVTDAKGQAAANKTVEITINGVTYKRTTDENGTTGLSINLNSGEYPVSIAVDDVTVNSTVTVMSTIDASDVVKVFRNDTQYYAIFTDVNGTALANITVSFNINGIIYNRTTDAKGSAKLNINLNAGEYIITAVNPVTGEMKSNTIKVISLIESDDLTKYYRNSSQFVVRIHSADGRYVGAGEEVKFNINGVFYTRTTNATGHAKLNINLGQGNYTVTTYYKDCGRGNQITVLPILSADDLVMKYRDGSQFKAKLVDGQGKAYAGQNVQFNINGVFYNRATDSTGTAKLNINLMPGEYIITSSYNGANIANKITIMG